MDISTVIPMLLNFFDVPMEYVLYAVIVWAAVSIHALDMTMVQFLAVMRMRTMRETGVISPSKTPFLWAYCMLVLVRGLLYDLWVQIFVCTVIGLELPPIKFHWWTSKRFSWLKLSYFTIEWLTTDRLSRWDKEPTKGWWTVNVKKRMVEFGRVMLDPSDTTGKHF